jgi:hypothetical protein
MKKPGFLKNIGTPIALPEFEEQTKQAIDRQALEAMASKDALVARNLEGVQDAASSFQDSRLKGLGGDNEETKALSEAINRKARNVLGQNLSRQKEMTKLMAPQQRFENLVRAQEPLIQKQQFNLQREMNLHNARTARRDAKNQIIGAIFGIPAQYAGFKMGQSQVGGVAQPKQGAGTASSNVATEGVS